MRGVEWLEGLGLAIDTVDLMSRQMSERALVRIRDSSGRVVGAGFLAGSDMICTCAHVAAAALGGDSLSVQPPGGAIDLDFPLLPTDGESGARRQADVVAWIPERPDDTGDLAVLRLRDSPPRGARGVMIARAGPVWGHEFRVLGFPERLDHGVWAHGELRGTQGAGWVQMDVRGETRITRGFSGAPVWDAAVGAVVGMVVAAERSNGRAYLIPTGTLLSTFADVLSEAEPVCPYPGLAPFDEQDERFFHGRDREIGRLAELLRSRRLVFVTGPSGSGKSSLVRAGLWPRLRREGSVLVDLRPTPGEAPAVQLASTLLPLLEPAADAAGELARHGLIEQLAEWLAGPKLTELMDRLIIRTGGVVLLLDQFEEIAATDPTRGRELLELVAAMVRSGRRKPGEGPRLRAVCTIRSSVLDEVLTGELTQEFEAAIVYLGPMDAAALRAAITAPLAVAGWREFEPGLVDRIVDDAQRAAGQLPLVQFALNRLWDQARDGQLTNKAYTTLGGVAGALAAHADDVYRSLSTVDQRRAEQLLVQLAAPAGDGGYTVSPVRVDQLDPELLPLVRILADERLVAVRQDRGQPEVAALAHEALAREWKLLRGWLDAAREFRAWQEQLRVSLLQWLSSGCDSDGLLRGAALVRAEEWLRREPTALPAVEQEYIAASQAQRRRGTQRARAIMAVIALLGLLAAMLAGVTVNRNQQLAEELRRRAALSLAEIAERRSDTESRLGVQLAQAAWQHDPTSGAAYAALLRAYTVSQGIAQIGPPLWSKPITSSVATADGRVVALAHEDGEVMVWIGLFGASPQSWTVTTSPQLRGLALSNDGTRLAVVDERSGIRIWNTVERTGPVQLRPPAPPSDEQPDGLKSSAFSPDGKRLVVTLERDIGLLTNSNRDYVQIWDTDRGQPVPHGVTPEPPVVDIEVKAVQPDNRAAVFVEYDTDGTLHKRVRDLRTGAELRQLPGRQSFFARNGTMTADCQDDASPDGSRLGRLTGWDVADGAKRLNVRVRDCPGPLDGLTDTTGEFAVLGNGGLNDAFQTLELVDLQSGQAYRIPVGQTRSEPQRSGLVVLRNPDRPPTLYVLSGGVIRFQAPEPVSDLTSIHDRLSGAVTRISNDGKILARRSQPGGSLELLEASSGRQLATANVPLRRASANLTFTTNGQRLLAFGNDELIVFSVPDLTVQRRIRLPVPAQAGPEAWHGWNSSMAIASDDEVVVFHAGALTSWRISTGRQRDQMLPIAFDPKRLRDLASQSGVAARPNHPRQVVVGLPDGVQLWDLDRRQPVSSFRPLEGADFRYAMLHPDGELVALLYDRGRLEIGELDTGKRAQAAVTIPGSPTPLAFTRDGKLVTDGEFENPLQFWDVTDGTRIATLNYPGVANRLNWHMRGTVLSASTDAGIVAIELDPQAWIEQLCRINDREYSAAERNLLPRGAEDRPPCRIGQ